MHIVSTGIIGIGIAEKKYIALIIVGIVLHFGLNVMMLQGVL